MMLTTLRSLCAALLLCLLPAPAAAQETVSDIVNFLVTNRAVQTDDFERDRAAAEAARQTIARALLVNLTSVPLASSSSGFLYRLNPALGTMERATESFGPFFVERALTAGHGRASFGVSAFSSGFDRLGDLRLRDGSLVTVANQFRDEPAAFNTESLTLLVRSTTLTIFGSVGVTDRLEIGGALPLVQLTVEGERQNVYRGQQFLQASGQASASGVGDVALRAKYTLLAARGGAVAAAAEVRLPTGDETNLLGAGAAAYRFMGIGSIESGRLTLHGNGGLVFGGVSDEVHAAGAATFAVRPRVTLSGELMVRRVAELSDVRLVAERHPSIIGVDTQRLLAGEAGMTLANAVAGVKWNVGRALVLGGHVAFPLVRRGLTAPLTPTLALEYAF
ncbi:MAG TPA: transporter [Vicinamibacterales bacterium]|nr:transporter [Vicinamibacterales bacterium]